MTILIKPLSDKLGALVSDLNLINGITEQEKKCLLDAYVKYQLLVFKQLVISPEIFFQLAQVFGKPYKSLSKFPLSSNPKISVLSNVKRNGQPIGAIVQPLLWHSDSFVKNTPDKTTLLHCIKAPLDTGETLFVNTRTAYDTLPKDLKLFLSDKKIIYKHIDLNKSTVKHPIVLVDRITNKKSLYVNINNALGIEKIGKKKGIEIIQLLYNHVTKPENIFTHKWDDGDVLVWDNFSTMHAPASLSDSPRILHRIVINNS